MHSHEGERQSADIPEAVRAVKRATSWQAATNEILRQGRDMDSEEWARFLDALRAVGYTKLANAAGETYEKNGVVTVPTVQEALRRIETSGNNYPAQLRHGIDAMTNMDEKGRAAVISNLRGKQHKAIASALEEHFKAAA